MFVAANNWCDGIEPPPSLWLAAPNDSRIVRDAKGNALVRFLGGKPWRPQTIGCRKSPSGITSKI